MVFAQELLAKNQAATWKANTFYESEMWRAIIHTSLEKCWLFDKYYMDFNISAQRRMLLRVCSAVLRYDMLEGCHPWELPPSPYHRPVAHVSLLCICRSTEPTLPHTATDEPALSSPLTNSISAFQLHVTYGITQFINRNMKRDVYVTCEASYSVCIYDSYPNKTHCMSQQEPFSAHASPRMPPIQRYLSLLIPITIFLAISVSSLHIENLSVLFNLQS